MEIRLASLSLREQPILSHNVRSAWRSSSTFFEPFFRLLFFGWFARLLNIMLKAKIYLAALLTFRFPGAFPLLLTFAVSVQAASPITIAHRGASGYLPEHTLEAAALAYGMGADYIEQDLVLTKDNVPVVLHDIQIDTVTDVKTQFPDRKRSNGRFYALDFTLAELKQLNVTERVNHKNDEAVFADRFPAWTGSFKIATLEEQIEMIQGLNKSTGRNVGIYPELKQASWHRNEGYDLSAIVIPILQKHGYQTKEDPCWVQCFDRDEVMRVRHELGWEGQLLLLLGRPKITENGFEYAALQMPEELPELAKTVDGLGPSLASILDSDGKPTGFTKMAHKEGLTVHPYTVRKDSLTKPFDSIEKLHHAIFVDAEIDGVFTDFPDLAFEFIQNMQ